MGRLLATSAEVERQIGHLAQEVVARYAGARPLFVCVLRGGAPFATRLMFAITRCAPDFHPELAYVMAKTYGTGRQASQPRMLMDLAGDVEVAGRPAVILDDVLDNGVTADFIRRRLLEAGAARVDLGVLVEKDLPRDVFPTATFRAFASGPGWIAGMGMDDASTAHEAFRWLEEIRILD